MIPALIGSILMHIGGAALHLAWLLTREPGEMFHQWLENFGFYYPEEEIAEANKLSTPNNQQKGGM